MKVADRPRAGGVPAAADETSPRQQSLVLAVLLLGVSIAAVDTTIVVLGLPVMMADLHADIVSMVWVIMAYLLVLTMLSTQVGRFGDMFGRVRMYQLGFVVFTAGSLLCGLAASGPQLIAFRVLQGVGGALLTANSGAIVADNVPRARRGRAYGIIGIGWSIGAVLGILLGGVLITFINWRYIFFINVPIGIVALAIGYRVLRDRSARTVQRIDWVGMVFLGGGLYLILLALTNMTGAGWTAATGVEIATGVVLIGAFAAWERAAAAPMLDLTLFQYRVLTASVFAALFQALGSFAVMFLVIMYLQGVRGLSPFYASLLLVPGYLIGAVLGPWAGRIADRRGSRLPVALGLAVQAVGVLLYTTLVVDSPLWFVVVASVVNGAGNAFFFPSNNSAVVAHTPARAFGVANGLLRTLSNIGMVGSFAVALLMAASAIPRQAAFAIFLGVSRLTPALAGAFVKGMHAALLASISLIAIALALSLLQGRAPAPATEDREGRWEPAPGGEG